MSTTVCKVSILSYRCQPHAIHPTEEYGLEYIKWHFHYCTAIAFYMAGGAGSSKCIFHLHSKIQEAIYAQSLSKGLQWKHPALYLFGCLIKPV